MPSPIFIVDSSPAVRRLVEQISAPEGFDVVGFHDGPAALEAARRASPSLIIADYNLANMTFSGFCREITKLDHLTETQLISLINPADRPDEQHLRSLGVKACLNKPFQSDDLLGIIRSVQQPHQAPGGTALKRRAWPPTATSTDSDQADEPPSHRATSPDRQEGHTMNQQGTSQSAAPAAQPGIGPQDAMKGLFDQLLHSMTKETESRLASLLPRVIEEHLAVRIRPLIEQEIRSQLGDILSAEQLTGLIGPLLTRELPSLLRKEIANSEPLIKQAASEAVGASVKEKLDQWVRDEAEAGIRKQLPDLIRAQVGSIDQMVKDEVRAAVQQAPLLADDIVRTAAQQSIDRAVQQVVPELAEQHIKAELKRLTAPN